MIKGKSQTNDKRINGFSTSDVRKIDYLGKES